LLKKNSFVSGQRRTVKERSVDKVQP